MASEASLPPEATTASSDFWIDNLVYIIGGIIAALLIIFIVLIACYIKTQCPRKKEPKSLSTTVKKTGPKVSQELSTIDETKLLEVSVVKKKDDSESQASSIAPPLPLKPREYMKCSTKKAKKEPKLLVTEEDVPGPVPETTPPKYHRESKKPPKEPSFEQPPTVPTEEQPPEKKAPEPALEVTQEVMNVDNSNFLAIWRYFALEREKKLLEDPVDVTQKSVTVAETTTMTTTTVDKPDKKKVDIFDEMKRNYSRISVQKPDDDEMNLLKAPIIVAINKATEISKTIQQIAELQNCFINSSTGYLDIGEAGRLWLQDASTPVYHSLWCLVHEYKWLFPVSTSTAVMEAKFSSISIPVLYCYVILDDIPQWCKIMALQSLREKARLILSILKPKLVKKLPHPLPAMYVIHKENPSLLNNPDWKCCDPKKLSLKHEKPLDEANGNNGNKNCNL